MDRNQRVRGLGSLADVTRYNQALSDAEMWPWEANLANARYEPIYLNWQAEMDAHLAADTDLLEIPVFEGEVTEEFTDVDVAFPAASELANYDTLEMLLESRCPNDNAPELGNCGAWDYLGHVWLFDEATETWIELARYITTYHREGRWVLDGSAAMVLLQDGGTRTIRYTQAPGWNTQPTKTWLSFRFSNRGKGMKPTQAHTLWGGAGFNSAYNTDCEAVEVAIPSTAQKVEVYAIITGHGMEASNCAEFCNHEHEFTVNGESFTQDWPAVGNQQGCAETVNSGTVPSQGGTWWFGRGGWCPGRQVDPVVWDVTDIAGDVATASYRGLLGGTTPPDGSGNISMSSWLVIYE